MKKEKKWKTLQDTNLVFTFPKTTQQSLIMYRLGALSVASTIMSYLTKLAVMETTILAEFFF